MADHAGYPENVVSGSVFSPFAITSMTPDSHGIVNKPGPNDLTFVEVANTILGETRYSDEDDDAIDIADEPDATPRVGGVYLQFVRHLFGENRHGWMGPDNALAVKLQASCDQGAVLTLNGYEAASKLMLANTPDVESDTSCVVAKFAGAAGDIILAYGCGIVPCQISGGALGNTVGTLPGIQAAVAGFHGLGTIVSMTSEYPGLGMVKIGRNSLICLQDKSGLGEDFMFFRRVNASRTGIDQIGPIKVLDARLAADGANGPYSTKGGLFFANGIWNIECPGPDVKKPIEWNTEDGDALIGHFKFLEDVSEDTTWKLPVVTVEEHGHLVTIAQTSTEEPWIQHNALAEGSWLLKHGGPGEPDSTSTVSTGQLVTAISKDVKGHTIGVTTLGIGTQLAVEAGALVHKTGPGPAFVTVGTLGTVVLALTLDKHGHFVSGVFASYVTCL